MDKVVSVRVKDNKMLEELTFLFKWYGSKSEALRVLLNLGIKSWKRHWNIPLEHKLSWKEDKTKT